MKQIPESGKTSLRTLKKVLRVIGRYRLLLAGSVALAALTVVLQLYIPVLFGDAIDRIVAQGQVDIEGMLQILGKILALLIAASLGTWVMNMINNRLAFRTVRDIRARAIRQIQRLPLSWLDSHSSGDVVQRIIADTDQLSDGLLLGFTQLFAGVVTIGVTLGFMFSKDAGMTVMVLVLTPVSFLVARFIASRTFSMFARQTATRGRQTALINELIGSQKIVKASESFREYPAGNAPGAETAVSRMRSLCHLS